MRLDAEDIRRPFANMQVAVSDGEVGGSQGRGGAAVKRWRRLPRARKKVRADTRPRLSRVGGVGMGVWVVVSSASMLIAVRSSNDVQVKVVGIFEFGVDMVVIGMGAVEGSWRLAKFCVPTTVKIWLLFGVLLVMAD